MKILSAGPYGPPIFWTEIYTHCRDDLCFDFINEDEDNDHNDDGDMDDVGTLFNPHCCASDTCNHGGQVATRPPIYSQKHP